MKSLVHEKQKAIELRKQGFSYRDIMKEIPVAKGTLSGWLNRLTLSPEEEQKLIDRVQANKDRGASRAALSNRTRRIARDAITEREARAFFEKNKKNMEFLTGIILYWAEGSKRNSCFSFINSDPDMLVVMKKWMLRYLPISEEDLRIRLFIHEPFRKDNLEVFWSKTLDFPMEKFQSTFIKHTPHAGKKNPAYRGYARIYVNKIQHLRTVLAWQKCLIAVV